MAPWTSQTDHCELRPSRAETWVRCPGSVSLARGLPEPPEHPSATYGSRAHAIAAQQLAGWKIDEPDDADMRDIIAEYVIWCEAIRKAAARTWVEFKVSLDALHPPAPMFGTLDFMGYTIVDGVGILDIVDLKTGTIPVSAEDNYQLQYYALAALLSVEHELSVPVGGLGLYIVQPRLHKVSARTTTPDALREFGERLIWAAEDAMSEDPMFHPGPVQCRWCPANHVCTLKYRKTMPKTKHGLES